MSLLTPRAPNSLTGSRIDRVSARRDDTAWVDRLLADPTSLLVPLIGNQHLVMGAQTTQPRAWMGPIPQAALRGPAPGVIWALLGLLEGRAVFAAQADDAALLGVPEDAQLADLRALATLLPADEAALLAHARGLLHWRGRHRFCGVCGAPCVPISAGNTMRCTGCGASHFPRTDPAVIMLVTRGDHALLGNGVRFPTPTMYSALAGFVEPGESLEEAVSREVIEETGVMVVDIRYHSSQPWPFPASVMLGFTAEAITDAITIDPEELRDARWFSRADLADMRELGLALPGRLSIAYRLIADWLAGAG